jgi:hypothetical protein
MGDGKWEMDFPSPISHLPSRISHFPFPIRRRFYFFAGGFAAGLAIVTLFITVNRGNSLAR